MLYFILITILLLCVIFFDFSFYIIPNMIPISISFIGICFLLMNTHTVSTLSIFIPILIFTVGLMLAYLNVLGFGDSKLIASLSLILGPLHSGYLIIYTILFGGLLALLYIILKKKIKHIRQIIFHHTHQNTLYAYFIPDLESVIKDAQELENQNHLPYGLAIAPAGIYVLYLFFTKNHVLF